MMKNIFSFWNRKKKNDNPYLEDLFEGDHLKYLSRKIILDEMGSLDGNGLSHSSREFVHVVVIGADNLSLHVARQAALICHYPNFNDETGRYRTIITIVNPQSGSRKDVEIMKTMFTEVTGNLMSECMWTCCYYGENIERWSSSKNESFIDVEFQFIGINEDGIETLLKELVTENNDAIVNIINNGYALTDETVSWLTQHCHQYYRINDRVLNDKTQDCRIDVRRAMFVNLLYNVGTHLKDICVSDIYEIEKYDTALASFCNHTTQRKLKIYWEKIKDVNLKLSNVFCADCIDAKLRSKNICDAGKNYRKNKKAFERLAKSEHARWNVEKLILGYRPYSAEEKYRDESLFVDNAKMKAERKYMKNSLCAHIDICSCRELIRVDPDNFKYDCFFTLAIDDIK